MALYLTLSCLAIAGASVAGGLAPLASVLTHTRLQFYLSFAAGTMLGAVFFHMLPEAVEVGGVGTLHWVALGLLGLFFLERFFSFHHHESHGDATESSGCNHAESEKGHEHNHASSSTTPTHSRLNWGAAAVGLAIHTIVGGFALASAFALDAGRANHGTAIGVLLATLVHKPADALTIVSLMVNAGVSRKLAHLVNLGFSLLLPIGAICFFIGRLSYAAGTAAQFTSSALAFSAGTFLCIALSDLLPELHFHEHDRFKLSAALLAGFGLMAATSLVG